MHGLPSSADKCPELTEFHLGHKLSWSWSLSRELELKSLSWWSWWSWSWSWWSWSWYLSPEPELKSWSSSWSLSPEPEPKSTPIISRSRCHLREMSSWEARSTFLKFSETSLNDLLQVVSRLIKLPFAALCSSDWLCADRRWGEEYVSKFFETFLNGPSQTSLPIKCLLWSGNVAANLSDGTGLSSRKHLCNQNWIMAQFLNRLWGEF